MDRDFFTADLHLGHAAIMKHTARTVFMTDQDRETFESARREGRSLANWKPGAASVERMDEGLIARINDRVPEDATLWVIGDFAFTSSKRDARQYRDAIRCRDLRIVWGNHDKRHHLAPAFDHDYEAVMLHVTPDRTFTEPEVQADKELRRSAHNRDWRRSNTRIYLNHYAQAVWHHAHRGVFHLYGHTHGNFEPWRQEHMPNALSMDVGVDCWDYQPLAFSQIAHVLGQKRDSHPPHDIDQRSDRD